MQDFRNLDAWHKGHAIAIDVHRTLARNKRVDAHLRSQLSKASRSIPGCLVEGCGKDSHLELARYADMSIGSCSEVEYWMLLGRDIGYFSDSDHDRITGNVVEVRRMLFGLRRGIRNKKRKPPNDASDQANLPDP
jgi:four helix bundle protein